QLRTQLLTDTCEHRALDRCEWRRLHAHGFGRSDVAREDDVEAAQIFPFTGRERDSSVIQNLEEQIKNERVRLLHLIEEQCAALGECERTAEQAGVVGMRAD